MLLLSFPEMYWVFVDGKSWQRICLCLWFFLLSNVSHIFRRTVHPTDIDVETLNSLLWSSLDSLQPWNAEWKKLGLKLHKVDVMLFSYLATRGPMKNTFGGHRYTIGHIIWKLLVG